MKESIKLYSAVISVRFKNDYYFSFQIYF